MIYAEWSPRFMRCMHIGVERKRPGAKRCNRQQVVRLAASGAAQRKLRPSGPAPSPGGMCGPGGAVVWRDGRPDDKLCSRRPPGGFAEFLYPRARKSDFAGRFPDFPSLRAAPSYRNSGNPPANRENPCTALQKLGEPSAEGPNRCTAEQKLGKLAMGGNASPPPTQSGPSTSARRGAASSAWGSFAFRVRRKSSSRYGYAYGSRFRLCSSAFTSSIS